MAKRYIPGISGLLTEPNPADSPSNTLSEAENVIIDQRGKVQARHGFNVINVETYANQPNLYTILPSMINLNNRSEIKSKTLFENTITIPPNSIFKIKKRKYENIYVNDVLEYVDVEIPSGTYLVALGNTPDFLTTITDILNKQFNEHNISVSFVENRIILSSDDYIEIDNSSISNLLGFTAGQFSYSNFIFDYQLNAVIPSNYDTVSDTPIKLIEVEYDTNRFYSLCFVKQHYNTLTINANSRTNLPWPGGYLVIENKILENVNRYYLIDNNSQQLQLKNSLKYKNVDNVFSTNKSLYFQTENGIVEEDLKNLVCPTSNRFFDIKWPSEPTIKTSFRKSDLFQNWFWSGYKIGLRYTFYREMGYNDAPDILYESAPSKIYEIFNDGEDSVLDITFDFNLLQDNVVDYNVFTKYNNGRKFGIKIYRTVLTPILNDENKAFALPTEYHQCYDLIPFDTIFNTTLTLEKINESDEPDEYSISNVANLSVYQLNDTRGELKENQTLFYCPSKLNYWINNEPNQLIFAKPRNQFNSIKIDNNDIQPAEIKVISKTVVGRTPRQISEYDNYFNETTTNNDKIDKHVITSNPDSYTNNLGFTLWNTELFDKYVNTLEFFIQSAADVDFSEIKVEIWDWDFVDFQNEFDSSMSSAGLTANLTEQLNYTNVKDIKSIQDANQALYEDALSGSNQIKVSYPSEFKVGDIISINSDTNVSEIKTIIRVESYSTVSWVRLTLDENLNSDFLLESNANITLNSNTMYNNSLNCIYTTEANSVVTGRIKITLPTILKWKSNTSIVVAIQCKNLINDLEILCFKRNDIHELEVTKQFFIFKWNDGENPTYHDVITTANHPGSICLSRCEDIYHYTFKAATSIQSHLPSTPINMEPDDYIKNNVDSSESFISLHSVTKDTFRYFRKIGSQYGYQKYEFPKNLRIRFRKIPENFTYDDPIVNDINENIDYYVIPVDSTHFKVALEPDGVPIVFSINPSMIDDGLIYPKPIAYVRVVEPGLLTNNKQFYPKFSIPLEFNDDTLQKIGYPLYTNSGADGTKFINFIAPKAKHIVPFKDFHIYAGIEVPLTGSFNVISQAETEQIVVGLPVYEPIGPQTTARYYRQNTQDWNIPILKSSKMFESYTNFGNAAYQKDLFIESSFIKDRPAQITSLSYTSYAYKDKNNELQIDSGIGTCSVDLEQSSDFIQVIVYNMLNTTTMDFTNYKNVQIGATLFERPYLTIKLTSKANETHYVSAQLTPSYNRQGYYPLIGKNGEFDNKYLQANNPISKLNYVQTPDTEIYSLGSYKYNIERYGLVPGMIEGTESGQAESDAKYIVTGLIVEGMAITNPLNKIYYNATDNTLTFNNIDRFAKDVFKEPGMLLMQMYDGSLTTPAATGYAIFYYTNITTESSNKHIFKNVVVKYMSANGVQIDVNPDFFSSMLGTIFNIWFIAGTTEEGLPLYAYNTDQVTQINIWTGSTGTSTSEYHNDSALSDASIPFTKFPDKPSLVFKPHKDIESQVVAVLNKDGNITFFGAAAQDYSSSLQDYSWSIIEEFNRELQNKGINAYLRKGTDTGQVDIIYPDGKQIDLLNGLYDETTGLVIKDGKHVFSPEIKNDSFTTIARSDPNSLYRKNQIQNSRRGIPEITPLACSNLIGSNTKEIIGAAQSVDDLYIFKEDGIFRLTDSGSFIPILSQSFYQFSTTSICVSKNSIQEINNEIIYLDQDGFMSIKDGGIQKISGAIERDILTLIQTTPKDRIQSFKNESRGLYYCTLINEVDKTLDVKSGTYIFNTKTRQWTFMDEEILNGIQDSNNQNLIALRQNKITFDNYTYFSGQIGSYAYTQITFNGLSKQDKSDYYRLTRETFTDSLSFNNKDQFDYKNLLLTSPYDGLQKDMANNGFIISLFLYSKISSLQTPVQSLVFSEKINKMRSSIVFSGTITCAGSTCSSQKLDSHIHDNVISQFIEKPVYIRFLNSSQGVETWTDYYKVRLHKVGEVTPNGVYSTVNRYVQYYFTFVESYPSDFFTKSTYSGYDSVYDYDSKLYKNCEIITGVPAKITFNPESGNNPDTNKLFQEYMIHTETTNKGAAMAFKTDSRADFSQDRNFRYDANATNRNVFRTYIPTKMSRGRYLIRQVKHDVPLENLIITGQTMVMRDSDNTRVQKNGDDE